MKAHNIALALREAYLSMHRQTNQYLLKYNITADQFVILAILHEHNGITQQELAQHATSDPNTIRAMLLLLEKHGLIIRHDHPGDGRAWVVSLTQKGKRLTLKLVKGLKPVRDKMLSHLSKKEISTLNKSLRMIYEELS